jgi:lysophospholipase L1-like esterase
MHFSGSIFDILLILVMLPAAGILAYRSGRWLRVGRRLLAAPRPTASPFARLFTVTVVSLAIILLLLELGVRFYVGQFGTEQDKIRYLYSADQIRDLPSLFVGQPYLGFALSSNYPLHNRLGYRGPEITQPKPTGAYRIVALGGSTTYGFGIDDYNETYPAQLQRILQEDYGYTQVEVINAGVPEYTSWESLVNLEFRVLDLDPDLLIYYEATNDITARLVYPENYNGQNPARGLWQTTEENLPPSALARFIALRFGWMDDPLALEDRFVRSDLIHCNMWTERECGDYDVQTLMERNPPVYYERNLRSMAAIAGANGIRMMFSSWAYFPDTTPISNIYTYPWRRDAVAEHNAIMQQAAADTGAAFYDLFTNLPYDRAFWLDDGYHQSPVGTVAQARLYAAFIVDAGLIG